MTRKPTAKALRDLDRAQMVVYDAFEAYGARRVALAHRALAISPLCADAYVVLAAEAEEGSDEALTFWCKGVEAGEAALGTEGFREMAGEFWGWDETRPYMRARLGLAQTLWRRGARDEAVGHAASMLELNPNDNQGVRYQLAAWLIEAGRDGELDALLARYEDDASAFWRYSAALSGFRREGDGEQSRKLLRAAIDWNAHAPALLLGSRAIPKTSPDFYGMGDENEAIILARDFGEGWRMTPGALDWLKAHAPSAAKPRRRKGA